MKKFAKVIITAMAMLTLCFSLTACNGYTSHYSAMAEVSTNTSKKATLSFGEFKGTYVIKLKSDGESVIAYNASLKQGNIKVYYDYNGEKLDLFEMGTDGSVQGKTEAFTGGKTVYVIIESDGKCNEGQFSFTLEK